MKAMRVRDAVAAGHSLGQLRGPSFSAPYWGVRTATPPRDDIARVLAFAPRLPERAFFCGPTAAVLWGVPLPLDVALQTQLHIGVRAGDRRVDAAGVRAHHLALEASEVTTFRGVRATSLVRTWIDLAGAGVSLAELVAAGDHVLRRSRPTDLSRAVAARAGRRGGALLRDAHALLDERADSAPESELRVAMLRAGLPKPEINVRLITADGRSLGRPDFSWARSTTTGPARASGSPTCGGSRASRSTAGWRSVRRRRTTQPRMLIAQLRRVLAAREST